MSVCLTTPSTIAPLDALGRNCRLLLLITVAFLGGTGFTHAQEGDDFRAVIMHGLGGDASYDEEFERISGAIADGLATLSSDPAQAVSVLPADTGADALYAAIEAAADARRFLLVLIGHGTANRGSWQFNVAGPDVESSALAVALDRIDANEQLVILAASASGAAIEDLESPGRIIVSATRNGRELNAVRFPEFLADAFVDERADFDRNEMLTLAEAFRFARSGVETVFSDSGYLQSEHARLSGDGAERWVLAHLGSLRRAVSEPALMNLLDARQALYGEFQAVLATRSATDIDVYYRELETILLKMARLQMRIDAELGSGADDAGS